MSTKFETDLRLEIAHILEIDVVEYSILSIAQQSELMLELNQLVRSTERFREAEKASKLIRLPTGDGMALVFFDDPEAPLECAVQLSGGIKSYPQIRLRMGIHSGPINHVLDVNDRSNVTGAGIDMAQRVMDCGDAGHILLSKRAADDLWAYGDWRSHLHDLGEYEVKHGHRISLVNFYNEELGNSATPKKLSPLESARPRRHSKSLGWAGLAVAALLAIAIAFGLAHLGRKERGPDLATQEATTIPEKSVAVLPFRNLSQKKADAYFADGVQSEILAALAKVTQLKVISPISADYFHEPDERNLANIAETLRTAHVLEGSVQRAGDRVRVAAKLVDARTNTQLWAEVYDRDVADVFFIQSEIAREIVNQLRIRLSPEEQAAIQAPPTQDLRAYDLYLRAKELSRNAVDGRPEVMRERVNLLEQAVARDPAFVAAYCQLVRANLSAYWFNNDHTPARLERAKEALDAAAKLQPGSGEVHLARARFYYWASRDYGDALAELELARRALPNDPEPIYFTSLIERRQGKWQESLRHMKEAAAMDPRNVNVFDNLAITYLALKKYGEAARLLDHVLVWREKDFDLRLCRARLAFFARADLAPLQKAISDETGKIPAPNVFGAARLHLALARRDYPTAAKALSSYTLPDVRAEPTDLAYLVPREWYEGMIFLGLNRQEQAQAAFLTGRERAAVSVAARPFDGRALMALAEVDVRLGRPGEAIREAEDAAKLLPIDKDALDGPVIARRLAGIYAQGGAADRALDQLTRIVETPNALHYGLLKLNEVWDPIRQDERFLQLLLRLERPRSAP